MNQSEIGFENRAQKMAWSEEFEHVPLKQRLKLLLASHRASVDSDLKSESRIPVLPRNVGIAAEQRENEHIESQSGCCFEEEMTKGIPVPKEESNAGQLGELMNHESLTPKCVNSVKIECAENLFESTSASYANGCSLDGIQAVTFKPEISEEYLDELDHVMLKERLRRFLTGECLGLTSTMQQENPAGTVKGELKLGDQMNAVSENQIHEIEKTLTSGLSKSTTKSSCEPHQGLGHSCLDNRLAGAYSSGVKRNYKMYSSEKGCSKYESYSDGGKTLLSSNIGTEQGSTMLSSAKIKIEQPNYDKFRISNVPIAGQMSIRNMVPVNSEIPDAVEEYGDELDHMLLRERMKLLSSRDGSSLDIHRSSKCMSKMVSSAFGCEPAASKPAQLLKIHRPRKRRKTVTDSVETALEEDAPGLLQVLIEKGVSVTEIKLYSEPESTDALDDSSTKDNFAELEVVIAKLFSQRESLLKLGPLRCKKGEKASYCLECLFSLVEQARYLQFRNWPVEWGWCRDLQSFIFVFERHNRIVLERPEYGYATYFFELADSLPIDWQIKRLVTAMKLTSCSRVTLIENKALMVGDDLTEGEAQLLMEYGWLPNTGLGTMLNYYDRVVHDRKSEKESCEWRSKIGKLLVDGYNGGTIISAGIPRKVVDHNFVHPMQIKLELS